MPYNLSRYSTVPSTVKRWRTPALLAVAGLAAAALYVNHKTKQAEADNPPQGKFIDVDGVRLHYTEQGSGDPLVLLHGNGITSSDFEASGLTARAAEQYRVIAFDRPGFGYSERPRSTIWTPDKQARLLHKALEQLGIALPRLNEIGGSHAQRDLFALVELDARLQAGDWFAAQQGLELRRRYDGWDVPVNRSLVGVYEALGLPEQAARARERVVRR